ALAVEGDGLRPRQRGGELDLVDLGGHAGGVDQLPQLPRSEVRDPDVPREALLLEVDQGAPGLQGEAAGGVRPVDQSQDRALEAQPAQRAEEALAGGVAALRSEEHTSELQSRFDLVCRLLLEKKNT